MSVSKTNSGTFHVFAALPTNNESANRGGSTKSYHKRKSHAKSRLGCIRCKAKRVKCEQGKPSCARCKNRNVTCHYSVEQSTELLDYQRSPSRILCLHSIHFNVLEPTQRAGTSGLQLLEHYASITCHSLTSPAVQPVFGSQMLPMAHQFPYLMHALLAISASHLQHTMSAHSNLEIALAFHWKNAAREFQRAVESEFSQSNADAIIITCVILNMLSFLNIDSENPWSSWVFSSSPDQLDWLSLQMGLRPLLVMTRCFRSNTILTPMFLASDDDQRSFTNLAPGIQGIPQAFVEICGLNSSSINANNVYHTPLRLLSETMKLEVTPGNLYLLVQFAGGVGGRFLDLLKVKEHRALLIFSYWLGKLCSMPLWWCPGRARRDCTAICMYLDQPTHDRRIRKMLEWPAGACDYVMKYAVGG